MMDFVAAYNIAEAIWWCGLGLALLAARVAADVPRLRRPLAGVLIVFGLSDLVEVWSGAWWRPWWLAAVKFACGCAIGVLAVLWFRAARTSARTIAPADGAASPPSRDGPPNA